MHDRFANNPAYVEYESLLVQLHGLIAAGELESDKAESIRDRMDTLSRNLNRPEKDRLSGLSGDLYMLANDETILPAPENKLPPSELWARVRELEQRADWEAVLALLRLRDKSTPADAVAYFRSRAYAALGHKQIAAIFLQHAATLLPESVWTRQEPHLKTA